MLTDPDAIRHPLLPEFDVYQWLLSSHMSASTPRWLPDKTTWDQPSYTESPTVALIDSGVATSHQAFEGAQILQRDFTGAEHIDDELGHGTHCAGLIVGQPHGGLAGLAPSARLLSGRVYGRGRQPKSATEAIVAALHWVGESAAGIVVLPFGQRSTNGAVQEAIEFVLESGATVISSGGNHAGAAPLFPSSMAGVLCVSGLARDAQPLPECYAGPAVDVFVPAENVLSAHPFGWRMMTGSSQAAAIFGGLIARQQIHGRKGLPGTSEGKQQ